MHIYYFPASFIIPLTAVSFIFKNFLIFKIGEMKSRKNERHKNIHFLIIFERCVHFIENSIIATCPTCLSLGNTMAGRSVSSPWIPICGGLSLFGKGGGYIPFLLDVNHI